MNTLKKALIPSLVLLLILVAPLLFFQSPVTTDPQAALVVQEIFPNSCNQLVDPVIRWQVSYRGPVFQMKVIRSSPFARAEREFTSPPVENIGTNSNRDIFSPDLPANTPFRYEFINLDSGQTLAVVEFDCTTGQILAPTARP